MNMIIIFIVSDNIWMDMYCLVILSFVIGRIYAEDMDKKLCGRVFHPNAMRCCKRDYDSIYKITLSDDIRECFQLSKDPVKCERETCIAQKKGFATDDDKIDKKKLEELMTKDFGSDPELLADVKSKCLNGDFEKYAAPSYCNFMKMRHCVSMQMLNNCLDWNVNSDCQEMKRLVAECVKIIA